jgi:protease-4
VAVIEVYGVIGNHVRVPVYSRLFDTVAKSRKYRAVVLDIDSPGGSASGSELLYHSIKKIAESKPVIAYVRGIGASGGYYLACAASKVVALPTALVGSIGVIYLRPVMEQLLGKVGVEFSVFKGGRLKDMGGFWRSPTPEEGERFQVLINEIYENFVSVVAHGRSLSEAEVRELATGEVVTARRGVDLGLVDQMGDFDSALQLAAELGNAKPRARWLRPRRSFGQRLFGRMGGVSSVSILSEQFQQLFTGGIYYLEPSFMLSTEWRAED